MRGGAPRFGRPVIAGNWKMHKGPAEAQALVAALARELPKRCPDVLLFPPSVSLAAAFAAVEARPEMRLGVQNVHWEREGAFTGEISANMAAEAGAEYVLVGHSERRHLFGETDAMVARKTRAVLSAGLAAIVCVGETLAERTAGQLEEVLARQLDAVLGALGDRGTDEVALAYEPVWAIGTGETATPVDAAGAHALLRARLAERWGEAAADAMRILYGGSVKPDNAAALTTAAGVDGLLIGGASLDPASFTAIAKAAWRAAR
jgi:triosephosphate isomerase (TIM)